MASKGGRVWEGWKRGRMEDGKTRRRGNGGQWGRMGSCLNGISIAGLAIAVAIRSLDLIIHSLDQITRIARRGVA